MKTETKHNIVDYISKRGKVRAAELINMFKMTSVGMHKHLRELIEQGKIKKNGKAPHVYYSVLRLNGNLDRNKFDQKTKGFIHHNLIYISATGETLEGMVGYIRFMEDIVHNRTGSTCLLRHPTNK